RKFGVLDARWEHGETVVPQFGTDFIAGMFSDLTPIATGSQLYRRRWIDQVGEFDETYTNGEDHELAFRVAFAGGRYEFAPSDRPLFFYRRHGPSLTNRSGHKNAEAWLRLA